MTDSRITAQAMEVALLQSDAAARITAQVMEVTLLQSTSSARITAQVMETAILTGLPLAESIKIALRR